MEQIVNILYFSFLLFCVKLDFLV